jgi:hypothetical protein
MTYVVAEPQLSHLHPTAICGNGTRKPLKIFQIRWHRPPSMVATGALGVRYEKSWPMNV